jgi:CHASE3 domain sensor protein
MDQEEFNQKLDQIEEQAQLTLAEFPKTLTKERQRMIIALVRYIRAEAERSAAFGGARPAADEALARLRSV